MVQYDMSQKNYIEANNVHNKNVKRIGFWAAVLTAVLAAAFIIMGMSARQLGIIFQVW